MVQCVYVNQYLQATIGFLNSGPVILHTGAIWLLLADGHCV